MKTLLLALVFLVLLASTVFAQEGVDLPESGFQKLPDSTFQNPPPYPVTNPNEPCDGSIVQWTSSHCAVTRGNTGYLRDAYPAVLWLLHYDCGFLGNAYCGPLGSGFIQPPDNAVNNNTNVVDMQATPTLKELRKQRRKLVRKRAKIKVELAEMELALLDGEPVQEDIEDAEQEIAELTVEIKQLNKMIRNY